MTTAIENKKGIVPDVFAENPDKFINKEVDGLFLTKSSPAPIDPLPEIGEWRQYGELIGCFDFNGRRWNVWKYSCA